MRKKFLSFFAGTIITVLLLSLVFYIAVSLYYSYGYVCGTYINGIYSTGADIDSINDTLCKEHNDKNIVISTCKGEKNIILLSDIDYKVDYTVALSEIFKNENPWYWPLYYLNIKRYQISPDVSYNSDKLKNKVLELDLLKDYSASIERGVAIIYDSNSGFSLNKNLTEYLDSDEVYEFISNAIFSDTEVFVDNSFYHEYELSEDEFKAEALYEEISNYLNCNLIIDMGDEQITIDKATLSSFVEFDSVECEIKRNSDNSFYIDNKKIEAFVSNLCDSYDTYMYPRDYVTYKGEIKHIIKSTYGTLINRNDLCNQLYNAVNSGCDVTILPFYTKEPFHKGLNDIGDTFVEVDLTNQVFYYIVDGEIKLEFDIVSGKPNGGNETPEVVCYIYKKQRNRYLKGADYISFVSFWIPFYKADGFHDASWQREFGGERYIRYGSHGCINMRLEDVSEFYEMVEVGTPVIIYK